MSVQRLPRAASGSRRDIARSVSDVRTAVKPLASPRRCIPFGVPSSSDARCRTEDRRPRTRPETRQRCAAWLVMLSEVEDIAPPLARLLGHHSSIRVIAPTSAVRQSRHRCSRCRLRFARTSSSKRWSVLNVSAIVSRTRAHSRRRGAEIARCATRLLKVICATKFSLPKTSSITRARGGRSRRRSGQRCCRSRSAGRARQRAGRADRTGRSGCPAPTCRGRP